MELKVKLQTKDEEIARTFEEKKSEDFSGGTLTCDYTDATMGLAEVLSIVGLTLAIPANVLASVVANRITQRLDLKSRMNKGKISIKATPDLNDPQGWVVIGLPITDDGMKILVQLVERSIKYGE
jgi:hypothetical protein